MSVSKTTDGGATWQRYNLSTSSGFTIALAVDPVNSNTVFAGGYPELYKTTDAGASWTKLAYTVDDTIFDIVINPDNPNTVYLGTLDGIYKSTDGGTNWTNMGLSNVTSIVIDPLNSETVYAGTRSGVYKSTSGGNSWIQMNQGLIDTSITSLGINPNNYLFAGTENSGMSRWSLGVGITEDKIAKKVKFSILPNPSFNNLSIHFALSEAGWIILTIYDIQGVRIKTICNQSYSPGHYQIRWNRLDENGKQVSSGIYLFQLSMDNRIVVKKVVLLN